MKKATYWIVFVLLAVAVGAYMGRGPWEQYHIERAHAAQAEADMKKAEKERAELVEQKSRFRSPAGREQLARENGYVKDGEVPLDTKP